MTRFRSELLGASSVAFIILGAVSAISLIGVLIEQSATLDAFQKEHRSLFVALVLLPPLVCGIALGLIAWVLCLRRKISREEMVRLMKHPGNPEWVSLALERLIVWAYALHVGVRR